MDKYLKSKKLEYQIKDYCRKKKRRKIKKNLKKQIWIKVKWNSNIKKNLKNQKKN